MPSPKTPECGMISFHPKKEEYTPEIIQWFLKANWSIFFDGWVIIEEKKSHLHVMFKVKYEAINKKREEAEKKIYNFLPDCFCNKEYACKITWPDKKKGENFVKGVGYILKEAVRHKDSYEVLIKHNISDEEWNACLQSAKEHTVVESNTFITLPEIAILAKKYIEDNQYNTIAGFLDFIADTGRFYTCREQQVENLYQQACNMKRRKLLQTVEAEELSAITIDDYNANHQ